jgi:hypothetical protein
VPPLVVFEFLHRVVDIFEDYFDEVTEPMIKENFVSVYQVRPTCTQHRQPGLIAIADFSLNPRPRHSCWRR